MIKTFIQGIVLVIMFFATWFLLSRIDWMGTLRIEKITDKTEEKLSKVFRDIILKSEKENKDSAVIHAMDSIVNKICEANDIDRGGIKVHVLEKDEINAFAIPGRHIMVYSGLILAADNPEELTGVICHELAHIEMDHVMKKMVREVGLSALLSISAGQAGGQVIGEAVRTLSSTAFDRKLEKEADIKAVDYLAEAKLNPEPFANFLFKLSGGEVDKYLSWISTHPESKERAKYIIEYSKEKKTKYEPVLSSSAWSGLQNALRTREP